MRMRVKNSILIGVAAMLLTLTSCVTPRRVNYLQDMTHGSQIQLEDRFEARIAPYDDMSIVVSSAQPNQELVAPFNVVRDTKGGYLVDVDGNIDFPVLGNIHIEGMTRDQVQKEIKQQLISQSLCKDPIVTVAFYNMNFSVLGSAGTGVKSINKDRITLLEAIAMGDLNINGLRKNILVMRQEGDKQMPYRVDLTSAESVYNSPVYYIRQNDVIYVEPNNMAKRGSTVMGSSAYTPGFWFGMFSSVVSVGLLIWNLVK